MDQEGHKLALTLDPALDTKESLNVPPCESTTGKSLLLDLPLPLVQDILRHVVDGSETDAQVMRVRLVNRTSTVQHIRL